MLVQSEILRDRIISVEGFAVSFDQFGVANLVGKEFLFPRLQEIMDPALRIHPACNYTPPQMVYEPADEEEKTDYTKNRNKNFQSEGPVTLTTDGYSSGEFDPTQVQPGGTYQQEVASKESDENLDSKLLSSVEDITASGTKDAVVSETEDPPERTTESAKTADMIVAKVAVPTKPKRKKQRASK